MINVVTPILRFAAALAAANLVSASTGTANTPASDARPPATLAGKDFLTLPGEQWHLAWDDEFTGNTLDTRKWSIGLPWRGDDGTNRHHNSQYASVIADADVRVGDGSLHLTTRRVPTPNPKGGAYAFTEGLITTSGKFAQTYGYFEMRAKLPTDAGPGTWPAFWLLTQGWPPEMDILEYWGSQSRIHQGTVTRGADGKQHWDSFHQKNVSLAGWHTFGLEWGPGYQIYNIDGVPTNRIFGAYLPTTPHYILLNSGIESARPPRSSTTFPNDFVVDWVRVYARPDGVPALIDGDFSQSDPRPWQIEGDAAIVDDMHASGKRCLRLDATAGPAASAKQIVYGLKPNTRYRLTAFVRAQGATARMRVSDFGANPAVSPDAQKTGTLSATFTTGPTATSAIVACEASGEGAAFFRDVQLQQE